jgi:hypothetical protein
VQAGVSRPKNGLKRIWEGGGLEGKPATATDYARAEMLMDIIIGAPDGTMSQADMSAAMAEKFGVEQRRIQPQTSRALAILWQQGMVEFTDTWDGHSPIYRVKD